MKFVHIADMHFDSPFANLSDKDNFGDLRRLEQRKILKKVIDYIKQNEIKYLFISGDLYEHKYIKRSTIEYINNLFKEIPDTLVFIAPGNHDPIIKNSYYNKFSWSENVKIFRGRIEKVELDNVNIYGFGFDDFYCKDCGLDNVNLDNKDRLNILVIHGTLNGGNVDNIEYNPISEKKLKEKGFDYVALGHIHKMDYNSELNQRIVYPGSTISLGFDELGKHGMIVGDISKNSINLEFVSLDESEFELYELDVSDLISKIDLIEKINELKFKENNFIEIILKGKRNFEINKYELCRLILNKNVIKIKDDTEIKYDLEKLAKENTLKGIFIKEMLMKKNNKNTSQEERNIIEKAIEIGLNALN